MTKHFIEFFFTDNFPVGPVVRPIKKRDDTIVKLPEGAIGYRFFDREEMIVDGHPMFGGRYNVSNVRYYGTTFTLNQIKRVFDGAEQLVEIMKELGYERAIITKNNSVFFIEKEDLVMETV